MRRILIIEQDNSKQEAQKWVDISDEIPFNEVACIHRTPGSIILAIMYNDEKVYTDLQG